MAIEIERKFLVVADAWRSQVTSSRAMIQFYLSRGGRASVRVRTEDGQRACLTIKAATQGRKRIELEYPLSVDDARQMMELAEGHIIEKVRHIVPHQGQLWEVDVFAGANGGLVVAEAELDCETQSLVLPTWVGREVTDERRYYNASLAERPFKSWA
mgnify:CR=1 FL=1